MEGNKGWDPLAREVDINRPETTLREGGNNIVPLEEGGNNTAPLEEGAKTPSKTSLRERGGEATP